MPGKSQAAGQNEPNEKKSKKDKLKAKGIPQATIDMLPTGESKSVDAETVRAIVIWCRGNGEPKRDRTDERTMPLRTGHDE